MTGGRGGIVLAGLAGFAASAAHAEPVFVDSGAATGQGWATRRGGHCLVVTAGHVVSGVDQGIVVGRGGVRGAFSRVTRHPGADLAVLWIEGPLKAQCPRSGLGYDDSRPALARAQKQRTALTLEVVENSSGEDVQASGQIRSIPVQVDTLDPLSPSPTFLFIAARADLKLSGQGDSGAVIRDPRTGGIDAGQPLGIVVQEGEVNVAIRFDLAKALVESLETRIQSAAGAGAHIPLALASWSGQLADPRCGPLNALSGQGCGFAARPNPGSRTFDLILDLPRQAVRELRVELQGAGGVGVAVKETGTEADWTPVRYCRPRGGTIGCGLGGIVASRLRLSFEGEANVRSIQVD